MDESGSGGLDQAGLGGTVAHHERQAAVHELEELVGVGRVVVHVADQRGEPDIRHGQISPKPRHGLEALEVDAVPHGRILPERGEEGVLPLVSADDDEVRLRHGLDHPGESQHGQVRAPAPRCVPEVEQDVFPFEATSEFLGPLLPDLVVPRHVVAHNGLGRIQPQPGRIVLHGGFRHEHNMVGVL